MHEITIKNGTRVRKMLFDDFLYMVETQTHMCNAYTYDVLTGYIKTDVVYSTVNADKCPVSYSDFIAYISQQIHADDVAIVL